MCPTDNREERAAKVCVGVSALTTTVCGVVALSLTDLGSAAFFTAGVATAVVVSVASLLLLHICQEMSMIHIRVFTASLVVCVMLLDFLSSLSERKWPFFLLVMNMMLCCRAGTRFIRGIVVVVVLWMFVTMLESSARWGWYDSGGTASLTTRTRQFRCADPPCKIGFDNGSRGFMVSLCIILFNYFFGENNTVEVMSSVETLKDGYTLTEAVVEALARYDIDQAEKLCMEHTTQTVQTHAISVPQSEMCSAARNTEATLRHRANEFGSANTQRLNSVLTKLVASLQQYRPYLSDGLFTTEAEELKAEAVSLSDSVSVVKKVAVVFIDIFNAESLWRTNSSMMQIASSLYHSRLQKTCSDFDGILVKSVGDCVLATFEVAQRACEFGLKLQSDLMTENWPNSLRSYECSGHIPGIWNGVRILLGIDYGETTVEPCPISGAKEHSGATVRKAYLIQKCCIPGTVAVSEEVISIVRRREFGSDYNGSDFGAIGNPIVISMGDFHLVQKVFPNEYMTAMLPQSLSARKRDVVAFLEVRNRRNCAKSQTEITEIKEIKETIEVSPKAVEDQQTTDEPPQGIPYFCYFLSHPFPKKNYSGYIPNPLFLSHTANTQN